MAPEGEAASRISGAPTARDIPARRRRAFAGENRCREDLPIPVRTISRKIPKK